MKTKIAYALVAASALGFAAIAAAAELSPPYMSKQINLIGYYGNTVVRFNPGKFEYHSWYNNETGKEAGSAVYFNMDVLPNGDLALKSYEGNWKFDDGYRPRIIPLDKDGKEGLALEFNNYYPGQTWPMFLPGTMNRDIYVMLPGHQ